jgi:hypothetical protein
MRVKWSTQSPGRDPPDGEREDNGVAELGATLVRTSSFVRFGPWSESSRISSRSDTFVAGEQGLPLSGFEEFSADLEGDNLMETILTTSNAK